MVWRQLGNKPLVRLQMHICITLPQWVNCPKTHLLINVYKMITGFGHLLPPKFEWFPKTSTILKMMHSFVYVQLAFCIILCIQIVNIKHLPEISLSKLYCKGFIMFLSICDKTILSRLCDQSSEPSWMWETVLCYTIYSKGSMGKMCMNNLLWMVYCSPVNSSPLDKMATISQTTFSDAFSLMKSFVFWLKFDWCLFLMVQLTITQHCLR